MYRTPLRLGQTRLNDHHAYIISSSDGENQGIVLLQLVPSATIIVIRKYILSHCSKRPCKNCVIYALINGLKCKNKTD